jgi:hypothetical protein
VPVTNLTSPHHTDRNILVKEYPEVNDYNMFRREDFSFIADKKLSSYITLKQIVSTFDIMTIAVTPM